MKKTKTLEELKTELQTLQKEKNQAVREGKYEYGATLRDKEAILMEKIQVEQNKISRNTAS